MPPAYLEEKIEELDDAIEKIDTFSEHWDNMRAYGKILTEEDYERGTVEPSPK